MSNNAHNDKLEKNFFKGFIVASAVLSVFSIFVPLNMVLAFLLLCTILAFTFIRKNYVFNWYKLLISKLIAQSKVSWLFILTSYIAFAYALTAEITLHDTGLYHTQAIKWIQEYAVVPGLGNLHGRFAFNSHFFTLSALFTFEFKRGPETILVYPINATGVLVLSWYLFGLLRNNIDKGNFQKVVLYSLVLLFIVTLYPSWVNSPSPDIISAIFILYTLIYFIEKDGRWNGEAVLFLAALVFTALVIKLSNLFLVIVLVPALRGCWKQKEEQITRYIIKIVALGLVIGVPFLARNIVLSGYMIYPYPKLDVFNVDWKIPKSLVEEEKLHISTWAKIPRMEDYEVEKMSVSQWFPKWWARKSMPFKVLLAGNLSALLAFIVLWKQKMRTDITTLIIVWLNLFFWFNAAPDPRFVHGFLIFGFALSQAAILGFILEKIKFAPIISFKAFGLGISAIYLFTLFTVREKPQEILSKYLIYPKSIRHNLVESHRTNFEYFVPQGNSQCYDADLPCLPGRNDNVLKRGESLKYGFKSKNK